jgi:hypothetical protein
MLTDEIVRSATMRVLSTFVSDPNQIISPAETVQRYMVEQKLMSHEVDLKTFINTSFYDQVMAESAR